MKRIIKVTGYGEASAKPALTKVEITVKGTEKDFNGALTIYENRCQTLKKGIVELGYASDDVFIPGCDITPEYDFIKNERVFVGYKYKGTIELIFNNNNELLKRISDIVASENEVTEFRISQHLSDEQIRMINEEALALAMDNARYRAALLAVREHARLGEVIYVDSDPRHNMEVTSTYLNDEEGLDTRVIVPVDYNSKAVIVREYVRAHYILEK